MIKEGKTNQLLEDIKKLLIFLLIKQGAQGKDISMLLNVDPAIISRMVPLRKIKSK